MQPAHCIDLRCHSDRFRVWNEIEGRKAHVTDDPWDLILPGHSGFIAPHGGDQLVACTNHTLTTRAVLAAAPGAVVTQDGSDGQNIRFASVYLDAVAMVLRIRKRRHLPEASRAAFAAGRVEGLKALGKPLVQSAIDAVAEDQSPANDSEST